MFKESVLLLAASNRISSAAIVYAMRNALGFDVLFFLENSSVSKAA